MTLVVSRRQQAATLAQAEFFAARCLASSDRQIAALVKPRDTRPVHLQVR
jgi:hypothetical protein